MDDDDPFEWIAARCRISASQKEILRNAPYVLPNLGVRSDAEMEESMSYEDSEDEVRDMDDTIVMMSVPESSGEERSEEGEEVYRTPPERHSHSLTSSNEARIGGGEDVCEDEVDFGGEEYKAEKVDLSRDSEVDGCELGEDDSKETAECLPRAGVVSESAIFVDCHHFVAKLMQERKVALDTNKRVEGNVMKEDVGPSTGFRGVRIRLEGQQEDTRVVRGSNNFVKEIEDLMEEEGVPFSDCGGVPRGVGGVAGNLGASLKAGIKRIFGDIETESGAFLGDMGVGNANKLQHKGKDVVVEVDRVGFAATSICTSGRASSEFRKLPVSFFSLGSRGDGGERSGQGFGGVSNNKEGGVRDGRGDNEPGPAKKDGEAGTGDANGGAGKKASEPINEEPDEEELTENILKVLGFLAKPQRPVYKERVDIIGSAIKAGITFPRPSWWPEDSDDDSN